MAYINHRIRPTHWIRTNVLLSPLDCNDAKDTDKSANHEKEHCSQGMDLMAGARRSAVADDGGSIWSVLLLGTMAESRDISYLGLLARHRIITFSSRFHGSIWTIRVLLAISACRWIFVIYIYIYPLEETSLKIYILKGKDAWEWIHNGIVFRGKRGRRFACDRFWSRICQKGEKPRINRIFT